MDSRAIIEAILFVSEQPISARELAEVIEMPIAEVEARLHALQQETEEVGRGVVLREIAGGWRLYTHPEAREYVERFAQTERATRLSKAALETLAIVAYKQPVSRGQVSELRGVDSEHALRTLERRGLVTEVGHAPGPGSALLYGTSDLFLEKLGLNTLGELPPLADHVPPAGVVESLEEPLRPETNPSNGSTN